MIQDYGISPKWGGGGGINMLSFEFYNRDTNILRTQILRLVNLL